MVNSRKIYERAGGIAEELLYNIKTVTTFVNFDFELQRFGELFDEVEKLEKKIINFRNCCWNYNIWNLFWIYFYVTLCQKYSL